MFKGTFSFMRAFLFAGVIALVGSMSAGSALAYTPQEIEAQQNRVDVALAAYQAAEAAYAEGEGQYFQKTYATQSEYEELIRNCGGSNTDQIQACQDSYQAEMQSKLDEYEVELYSLMYDVMDMYAVWDIEKTILQDMLNS